jgi:phosphohistidine phosphatase
MRHGDAVMAVHNDRDRILSDKGKQQSVQSAKWLNQFISDNNTKIDISLVSPYIRAQQTFTSMKSDIQLNTSLTANSFDTKEITPSGNISIAHRNLDALILENQNAQAILLVSHLPFISYLLDEICNIQHSMIFCTGAIACIEYDISQSVGKLITVFTPD